MSPASPATPSSLPPPASDPQVHRRVALYAADGSVRGVLHGTLKTIRANVPAGGCWRTLPDAVRLVAQVPPASRLAAPAEP